MTEREVDEKLVLRFQAGDRAAFDHLVNKYRGKLFRVISRLIHDPADAEDVVQETFIRSFRALPAFRGDAGFYTWLFRIGVNTAKNHRVAKGRKAGISIQLNLDSDETADDFFPMADTQSPIAALENKQTVAALNRVLDAMAVDLSTPLILCELEGLSYQEIADIMACPIGTVRSRIFRARELIAKKLAPMVDSKPPTAYADDSAVKPRKRYPPRIDGIKRGPGVANTG